MAQLKTVSVLKTYGIVLIAGGVVLSSIPVVVNLGWQRYRCGPNEGSSMQEAITSAIDAGPS